jgi:hypothetical protein
MHIKTIRKLNICVLAGGAMCLNNNARQSVEGGERVFNQKETGKFVVGEVHSNFIFGQRDKQFQVGDELRFTVYCLATICSFSSGNKKPAKNLFKLE